jgi:hypothetical protein
MTTDAVRRDCIHFRIEGFSTIGGENDSCLRPLAKGPGWITPLRGGECLRCEHFTDKYADEGGTDG